MYVPKPDRKWSEIPVWVRVALTFFLIDVVSFYVGRIILGGDAARGVTREGKYFLTGHGQTVEVSRTVYYYSTIHLVSIFVALVVVLIGVKKIRPKSVM